MVLTVLLEQVGLQGWRIAILLPRVCPCIKADFKCVCFSEGELISSGLDQLQFTRADERLFSPADFSIVSVNPFGYFRIRRPAHASVFVGVKCIGQENEAIDSCRFTLFRDCLHDAEAHTLLPSRMILSTFLAAGHARNTACNRKMA